MPDDSMTARVLIAHDEPMVTRILEHKLRREGHRVRCVHSGAAAADELRAEPADVVLLDIRFLNDVEPAALTGWLALVDGRDDDGARRAMRAGAAGLVRLPFKPTAVAEQVLTLLRMVRT